MIIIKKITTEDSCMYKKMQELMVSSFPKEERRDNEQLAAYTDNNPLFKCNVIIDDGSFIGFVNYWNLDKAYYIEHLAVTKGIRNKGYGEKILKLIKSQLCNKLIVLEVEPPIDTDSNRRVNFYSRNGFTLSEVKYMQPPYRKGDCEFELKIMYYGDSNYLNNNISSIITELHKEVYGKSLA